MASIKEKVYAEMENIEMILNELEKVKDRSPATKKTYKQ